MKKALAILFAALFALSMCACSANITVDGDLPITEAGAEAGAEATAEAPAAPAASGTYLVTFAHGETYELTAGEDLVFTISCSAPSDMGPIADGEEGSGVTTTSGTITYSNVTLGGPNNYPTAETVTISGIAEDCLVTITPNEAEEGDFPAVTIGAGAASSAASDMPAMDGASDKEAGMPSGDKTEGMPPTA